MSGCALGVQSAGGSSRPVEFLDALLPQSGQTQFGRNVRKSEPASGWYVQDLCNVKTITWHSAYFVAHGWLVMCKKLYALSVLVPILTRIALQILLNELLVSDTWDLTVLDRICNMSKVVRKDLFLWMWTQKSCARRF